MATESTKQLTNQGRQGDCYLLRADDVDLSLVEPAPKDPRGLVLAEGETSSHYHVVVGKGAKLMKFRDAARQERLLIVGRAGAELRVIGGGSGDIPRHTPISIAPGQFLARVQRAWNVQDERSEMGAD